MVKAYTRRSGRLVEGRRLEGLLLNKSVCGLNSFVAVGVFT